MDDPLQGGQVRCGGRGSLQIIGAYNSHRELGEQWGYFSLREMERLIAKIKRDGLP